MMLLSIVTVAVAVIDDVVEMSVRALVFTT